MSKLQMASKCEEANLSLLQVLANVYVIMPLFLKLYSGLEESFGFIL